MVVLAEKCRKTELNVRCVEKIQQPGEDQIGSVACTIGTLQSGTVTIRDCAIRFETPS